MTRREESPSGIRGIHLTVSGRVQGVGFRYFVVGVAEECGVTGYVRNLENGDVEVWAEGAPEALDRLTEAVRTGPRHARVERVAKNDVAVTGRYGAFGTRY